MHLCIHGDMRDMDVDVNNYKYQTCPKKCIYKILQDQITIYIYIHRIYIYAYTLCLWHYEGGWPWLTGRCVELSAEELKDSKKPGFLAGRWWFSPVSWLDRSAQNMLGMSIHSICICMYHKCIILVGAYIYISIHSQYVWCFGDMFLVPGIWEARDCCHFLRSTMKITLCGGWGGGVG